MAVYTSIIRKVGLIYIGFLIKSSFFTFEVNKSRYVEHEFKQRFY